MRNILFCFYTDQTTTSWFGWILASWIWRTVLYSLGTFESPLLNLCVGVWVGEQHVIKIFHITKAQENSKKGCSVLLFTEYQTRNECWLNSRSTYKPAVHFHVEYSGTRIFGLHQLIRGCFAKPHFWTWVLTLISSYRACSTSLHHMVHPNSQPIRSSHSRWNYLF